MTDLIDALGWLTTWDSWTGDDGILYRLWEHLQYSFWATLLATAIALPIGLLIGHTGRGLFLGVNLAGIARAVPTLAVVVLVYQLRPLTAWPVILALTLLAVPSILANTVAGIRGVDPDIRDAARGMGMTGSEVLWQAEVPVGLPLVLAGIRAAANQVIATATVAAYVGLGGLGRFIIDGFALQRYDEVYGGAIVVVALVFAVEGAFALVQRWIVSPGVRQRAGRPVSLVSATEPTLQAQA
jgi:osmoprotectant transport system permease protein